MASKTQVVAWFLIITPYFCTGLNGFQPQKKNAVVLPNPEQNVMPFEPVHYSEPDISKNYQSSTKVNARGMGHLYLITKKFMNYILDGEPYPSGFIQVGKNGLDISSDYTSLGLHYLFLLLIAFIGLILAVIIPCAGLFFCCCRCAGKCGARSQPFDKRFDTCKRHFFAFLLSSVTVVIMFGVVCAIVTNEYMEEGAQNLPKNVRTSLQDTKLYLNNTKKEVNTLLITNFGELDVVLSKLLHKSGEIVKDKLGEISKAAVVANLTTIVQGLRAIRSDLGNIDSLTKSLQNHAKALEIALNNVREQLMERLIVCRHESACIDFLSNYNITALTLEANFTQLPDVTLSLNNVSGLLANDIENEVIKGRDQFDRIKLNIQHSVDRTIPDIAREISKAGKILQRNAGNVTQILDNIESLIDKNSYRPIDQAESVFRQYAHYRYYLGLGVSLVLVSVLFSLGIGLLCGYCGRRPDAMYSEDCCDKGTAARFLMMAVWIMFLSFTALVAVTLGYMVSGSVADRVVCSGLRNPHNSTTFELLDKYVDLSSLYSASKRPVNLSTIIRECEKNASVYKVLGIEPDSMSEYAAQFNMPERVRQLADSIVLTSDIVIVTPEAERQLKALAASPLNTIDLTVYTSVLNERITSIHLLQLASALNDTARNLPPSQQNVKHELETQAMYLEVHQERQVSLMVRLSRELHGNATALSQHLRFNHSSLSSAVDSLLLDLRQAQTTLNSQGPAIVRAIAEEFGKEFGLHIQSYLNRVEKEAQANIGKCWPISLVYNATVVSTCNNILDPFNGFWFSVGCVTLLFIPAIILSVKLSSLYQKSEPYPGALVEAEYLYDAYAERDQVPLQNVAGKKKKKSKKKTGASGYAAAPHLGREREPVQQQPVGDARGNWDEYGGSAPVPRYPPISSEYERPPPYYYPGPTQPQLPPANT